MKLQSFLASACLLVTFSLCKAQTISGIVNEYTPVLSFSDCDSSLLQVGSSSGFAPGDKVLIIQMKGATIDLTNTANFGNIISLGNAGNYEFNRIGSISGSQIKLLYKVEKSYSVNGKVQLIRVPEYDNVTADGLTCKAWDGTTGGVLAIDVAGTLTLQGAGIDVSAKGFRGGVVVNTSNPAYHQTGYFFPPDPNVAAQKGEGIAEISLNQSYGCGRAATGGGGGNAHNAGGGGGGNAGKGGNGGLEYYNTPGSPTLNTKGLGGLSVMLASPLRIVMGGGGGAGHANDFVGSSGGNGGGIAFIRANTIEGNDKLINANGENIFGPGGNIVNDGQGGGGAGGTVAIDVKQILSDLNIEAKGGRGGDCLFYVNSQIIGPGGGGGGGLVLSANLITNYSSLTSGGQNGIANQNLTNQAEPGSFGATSLGSLLVFYEDTIPAGVISISKDITFCPGSSVTIDGVAYSEPGTVVDTIPGIVGCDTVITYNLQYAPLDLIFDVENFYCENGSIKLNYSICNLGSGPLPDEVRVLFTTVNPTVEMATTSAILKFDITTADSCQSGSVTLSGLPVSDIDYTVVNFDGSVPTPFSFDDFPVTDIEECNYINNLDSWIVQLPSAPTLDLGPDVILCVDSTVVFDAGSGFVSYQWFGGGASGQTLTTNVPGIYWVEVTDSCGFTQRDSVLLTFSLLPDTQFPDATICAGDSLHLSLPGFDTYAWAPAAGLSCTDCADVSISSAVTTTYTLLATTTDGCVLRDTFTVIVLPVTTAAETREFCPNGWVEIGGEVYTQPGTVVDTTTGPNGCDLITTYTLILLPQPMFTQTIEFCKGDTVFIGGEAYTQPGTVVDTIWPLVGCDTIATYILKYLDDPNSAVSIDCIEDIFIASSPGTGAVEVDYDLPTVASTCPCPGIERTLTEGLPSGAAFPVTTTKVCYQAKDSCGNTATCCFNITVREEQPCDIKEIGCMKYELLDIKRNASNLRLTYRIRVTNFCANKMIYTAIQIPDGLVADEPDNNTIYTSEDGRQYEVRNPNFSPFYSIRFKSTNDSISGGNSDIFEYTLPPQADVDYIHVTSRLAPQIFYEAYLNTFNCPLELVSDKPGNKNSELRSLSLRVFPNPSNGVLMADLSEWQNQQVSLQVFDAQGQRVHQILLAADFAAQDIQLPQTLANGLYLLEIGTASGEKRAARFVLQR